LRPWIKTLDYIEKKASLVYAYFNNQYHARAHLNVVQLLEMRGDINNNDLKKAKARAERYAERTTMKS
jgi:uncharacterized protein YecE (DUF72 family)